MKSKYILKIKPQPNIIDLYSFVILMLLGLSQSIVWWVGWMALGVSHFDVEATFQITFMEYILVLAGVLYAYAQKSRLVMYLEVGVAVTFFIYFYLQIL